MKKTIILAMALVTAVPASADVATDVILPSNCEETTIGTAEFASKAQYASHNLYTGDGTFFFYDEGYIGNTTSPGYIKKISVSIHNANGGDIGVYVYNEPMITDEGIPAGEYVTDITSKETEIDIEGNYKYVALITNSSFSMDFNSISFTWETEGSGVESIEAEGGEAEYYNLQGVRVENPEKGMFIRVQNGKSSKIAIK